ncbi:MAG TPA: Wzz/FepE/Etk N-terminal domain-containing protein [Ardenticatenaceae bacterium]
MNPDSPDEIDLRPFLFSLLRRWSWVVGAAILGAVVVAAVILAQPRTYSATALLLFEGQRSQLALDERIVGQDSILSDRITRRAGLISIAQSELMAHLLPEEVVGEVLPPNTPLSKLKNFVSIGTEGDLIGIAASAGTPRQAQLLANEWSRAFVTHVNNLTPNDATSLAAAQQQVADARTRFDEAQSTFEEFIGTSHIIELDNRIASLTALMQGNVQAKQAQYATQLAEVETLNVLLRDAETLRAQAEASGGVSNLSENLAALALRLRSVGNIQGIQLQIDDLNTLELGGEDATENLDRLIAALREQIEARNERLTELSEAMATNAPAPGSGQTPEAFEAYYMELRNVTRQREELEGEYLTLTQERAVALEALEVLQQNLAEHQAAETQTAVEVVLVGEAPLPTEPDHRGLVRKTILGGVMGAALGAVAALAAGFRTSQRGTRRQPAVERPADSPSYS